MFENDHCTGLHCGGKRWHLNAEEVHFQNCWKIIVKILSALMGSLSTSDIWVVVESPGQWRKSHQDLQIDILSPQAQRRGGDCGGHQEHYSSSNNP